MFQFFGKQLKASQWSGCWGQTSTKAWSQKWLFVVAGNRARFPDIKIHGILFLTSSLCVKIKCIISKNVSPSDRDTEAVIYFSKTCTLVKWWAYLIKAGGMSLFITWSSVVWTVSFPTCNIYRPIPLSLVTARQEMFLKGTINRLKGWMSVYQFTPIPTMHACHFSWAGQSSLGSHSFYAVWYSACR